MNTYDTNNHCRSDATLGDAVRFLLQTGNDETADGAVSDWDVDRAGLFETIGVELEAFLERNADDLARVSLSARSLAHNWICARNDGTWLPSGAGLSAVDKRLADSARSQGPCRFYFRESVVKPGAMVLDYESAESDEWSEAYEAAREAYVY